jgi:hypothetical protein
LKYLSVFVVVFGLFAATSTATAQYKNWSKLTSFNAGYASLKAEDTGNNLDGYAFDFTYEQSNMDGNLAGGIMVTYMAAHDDDSENSRRINYQSLPIMLQGKYYLGSNRARGYLQGGAGIQFSWVEYSGPILLLQDGDSGITLGGGIGGYFFTDEKIFINVAYNLNYLSNSYYRDGLIHLFKLGIGFQND